MNEKEINSILSKVTSGESVSRDTLRAVAKAKGITQGKTKIDLLSNVKAYAIANAKPVKAEPVGVKRGPGRPKADPSMVIGYKVKIGLRYPNEVGELITNMKEAHTFPTKEAGEKAVEKLVADGQVRVWGGKVRAKFLPRYGSAS